MMPYQLPSDLLTKSCAIDVIGCGGTGSQVLTGLARLHVTLLALGHPGGLDVTTWDPDTVSSANLGRQLFGAADIGHPKAHVITHRVNTFFGLDWDAVPVQYSSEFRSKHPDIVISCVDSARARAEIGQVITDHYRCPSLWLDLGNDRDMGQVVLGEPYRNDSPEQFRNDRLPTVLELFPELASTEHQAKDVDEPSCSIAASISRQSLFVNQTLATIALNALFRLFRFGGLSACAWFTNLETGTTTALPIDAAAWSRFGVNRAASTDEAPKTRRPRRSRATAAIAT